MSARNHKAIFERDSPPLDHFTGELGATVEVCREFVGLEPFAIFAQRGEFTDAAQTTSTRKSIAKAVYSPTLATVNTACRMKVKRPVAVDEDNPAADVNYRIFNIEQIVNVKEQNRELHFMVVEQQ